VELQVGRIADLAGRPISALTRRDVALGLLSIGPDDALASLPALRRRLLAADNPMSAPFWAATEGVLSGLRDGTAKVGDIREWLEATGTEPGSIIGLHVWDEAPEQSQLQAEMHAMLVRHLEEKQAAGEIDPDQLLTGDIAAHRAYVAVQEEWTATPLPDGRVPMDVLLDEQDAEFMAEWAAADAEALAELRAVLDEVDERPLPADQLTAACDAARTALAHPGLTGRLLAACGGAAEQALPGNDQDLWLTLAAGVVSPAGEAAAPAGPSGLGPDGLADDEPDEVSLTLGALCALDHIDWLAAISTLTRGGPGTPASATDMARYVRDYCAGDGMPADPGDDGDVDEPAIAELFSHVESLWEVLGATDAAQRLTPLGWWGLPEALQKAWSPAR
jgi:hypothetical protein